MVRHLAECVGRAIGQRHILLAVPDGKLESIAVNGLSVREVTGAVLQLVGVGEEWVVPAPGVARGQLLGAGGETFDDAQTDGARDAGSTAMIVAVRV